LRSVVGFEVRVDPRNGDDDFYALALVAPVRSKDEQRKVGR
jgi:hypothetical protein